MSVFLLATLLTTLKEDIAIFVILPVPLAHSFPPIVLLVLSPQTSSTGLASLHVQMDITHPMEHAQAAPITVFPAPQPQFVSPASLTSSYRPQEDVQGHVLLDSTTLPMFASTAPQIVPLVM